MRRSSSSSESLVGPLSSTTVLLAPPRASATCQSKAPGSSLEPASTTPTGDGIVIPSSWVFASCLTSAPTSCLTSAATLSWCAASSRCAANALWCDK